MSMYKSRIWEVENNLAAIRTTPIKVNSIAYSAETDLEAGGAFEAEASQGGWWNPLPPAVVAPPREGIMDPLATDKAVVEFIVRLSSALSFRAAIERIGMDSCGAT